MNRLAAMAATAAIVAVALTAAFGAGSASATRLCEAPGFFTFCTSTIPANTPLKLVQLGKSKFEIGIFTVECGASTLGGETTNAGGAGEGTAVKVTFPNRAFVECTDGKGNPCETEVLRERWNGGFYGSGNKDGSLLFDNEWKFTCGANWCIYQVNVVDEGIVKGGEPARVEVKEEELSIIAGSTNKCAQFPKWSATYEVPTPSPMYVTEN